MNKVHNIPSKKITMNIRSTTRATCFQSFWHLSFLSFSCVISLINRNSSRIFSSRWISLSRAELFERSELSCFRESSSGADGMEPSRRSSQPFTAVSSGSISMLDNAFHLLLRYASYSRFCVVLLIKKMRPTRPCTILRSQGGTWCVSGPLWCRLSTTTDIASDKDTITMVAA